MTSRFERYGRGVVPSAAVTSIDARLRLLDGAGYRERRRARALDPVPRPQVRVLQPALDPPVRRDEHGRRPARADQLGQPGVGGEPAVPAVPTVERLEVAGQADPDTEGAVRDHDR